MRRKTQPKTSCGTWTLPKNVDLKATMRDVGTKRDATIRLSVSIAYSRKMRELLAASLSGRMRLIAGVWNDYDQQHTWIHRFGDTWVLTEGTQPTGDGDMSIFDSAAELIQFYGETLRGDHYRAIAAKVRETVEAESRVAA
mgnify:CR=1 FL=1